MSAKKEFLSNYIRGIFDKISFWFLFRKIINSKKLYLWECYLNKLFFETKLKDKLEYTEKQEDKDRNELAAENKKEDDKKDKNKILILQERISLSKAIKAAYRTNNNQIEEIKTFFQFIEIWKKE